MQKERWDQIRELVEKKFGIEETGMSENGETSSGSEEYLVFKGPMGTIKLVYSVRPKLLDKKVHYSNRIGSSSKVDYIYDENEKTSSMAVFKLEESSGDWVELRGDGFSI